MAALLIILSLYNLHPCQPFTNPIITFTHKPIPYYSITTTSLSKKYLFVLYASSAKSNKNHIKQDDKDRHGGNDASLDFISLASDERLQKVIARAGIASRRAAEKMILDGRVSVNNKIINELGSKVNHRKDVIVVDGQRLSFPDQSSIFWIALNKPKSLLTTMHDDMNRETILSLIPRANELRLIPVGGLDRDHTGLMLLTNEIGWIHPLTHPSYSHSSRYEVVITGFPTEAQLEMLRKGVTLEGDRSPCPGCSIAVIDIDNRAKLCLLDVQLDETTPSQLERMMEFIDHPVVSLKRLEFCNVKLKALRRGQWRELSKAEVDALKSSCQKLQTSTDRDSNSRPSININRDTNSRPSIRDDSDANLRPSININRDTNSKPSIRDDSDANSRPSIRDDIDSKSRPSIKTNRDTNSRPSIKTDRDINSRPSIRDDSDSKSRPSIRDDSDANSRPSIRDDIDSKSRPSIRDNSDSKSRPSIKTNRDTNSRPSIRDDSDSKSRPSININRDTNSRPSIRDDSDANSRPSIRDDIDSKSRPSIKTNRDNNSRPSIRDDSDSKSRPSIRDDSDAKSRPSFFSRINARLLKDKPTS